MVRAILFDFGGTLDGDGHWLDRFATLYANAGIHLSRERLRAAFDEAERRASSNDRIATANLKTMIELHLEWQFAHLGLTDERLRRDMAQIFLASIYQAAPTNVRLLADLVRYGFKLGVVSNGCGNTDLLCAELGYAPYLSVIIDSRRVNLHKPDRAIFIHAATKLEVDPADAMVVGDSFERDIRPAKKAGMRTAWLQSDPTTCPDRSIVDLFLRELSDLSGALSPKNAAIA